MKRAGSGSGSISRGTDPRIRIRTKMSRIRNTAGDHECFAYWLESRPILLNPWVFTVIILTIPKNYLVLHKISEQYGTKFLTFFEECKR